MPENATGAQVLTSLSKVLAQEASPAPAPPPAKTFEQTVAGMSDHQVLQMVLGAADVDEPGTETYSAAEADFRRSLGI